MGERLMLAERNLHALRDRKVFSVVIDIMESSGYRIPYSSNLNQLNKSIHSTLVGVIVHGGGMRLYRTTNTVTKGANLIIHCILTELSNFCVQIQTSAC